MPRNPGRQKRTILMPCGKTIVGSLREADNKAILHRKYCESCSQCVKYEPAPYQSHGSDLDHNITMSRHGNINKAYIKSIHAYTMLIKMKLASKEESVV